ncbi:MAG: BspA family leucine-rich repeat surface protein [Tannerella sp.]|nr:BspA family leucine-rich repeat surface protein [Tannerella sp.]
MLETVFADNAIESDHITSAQYMFSGCSSLQSMELDFPSCKNFAGIFSGCSSLNDIKLVCDSGTNFGASFQGVKMLIEDILNPSDPKYFNFDNAQNVSLLFDKCSTNENLNLDLSAKFPNTISGDSMFSNVKFNLAKPEVHVTGFYSAFAKMFSGATGIDGSNNIQPMHLIEYTLNKDTSLAEEFQNMLLESVIIHENGYKVTSYAGTFKGTKHLLEIPDLPASNATTMYQMFNGAVLDIQDSMNYVNPYTYDLSNCTTIENMFRDTAATENIANDMITSEFFPKFINTDKLVNCNFAFQSASLVTGVWNRPVTDNLVEYGHTFGNQRFITSFDNSVKFNVYKTMNSFIGVGEQLPQESGPTYAFTGAGYTTPIDVYMKKDSNDSNNSINCGGLFSRCTSMTESPTINL